MEEKERIAKALEIAGQYGGIDGEHHKAWVIDQMVRALTGCLMVEKAAVDCHGATYTYQTQGESDEYATWFREQRTGDDGPDTYTWSEGIAP